MHCVTESLVDWADLYGWNDVGRLPSGWTPLTLLPLGAWYNELFLNTWMQIPLLCLVARYCGRDRLTVCS